MDKQNGWWSKLILGPFFAVIGYFYRVYTANRDRVGAAARPAMDCDGDQGGHGIDPDSLDRDLAIGSRGEPQGLNEMLKDFWGGLKSLPK